MSPFITADRGTPPKPRGGHSRAGMEAVTLAADLSQSAEVRGLIPRCVSGIGAPNCLVNNASLFLDDSLASLEDESWQAHMNVNMRAPVLLAQSMAAHLPPGAKGHVVNIVDQRVLRPAPSFFSYSASKAGLWWVTRTMAQALAPAIRVNADRARAGFAQHPSIAGGIRCRAGRDAAWPWSQPGGNRGGGPLPARNALHHRPDDLRRWRPASGVIGTGKNSLPWTEGIDQMR